MVSVSEVLKVVLLSIPVAIMVLVGAEDIALLAIVFVLVFLLVKGADR